MSSSPQGADDTHETELKLELTPDDAAVLEASELLGPPEDVTRLRSIYFDTPDCALREAGLSLRIRSSGRKRIQTIKADQARGAGLFARPEWELPVRNRRPVPDDRTPVPRLLAKLDAEVEKRFAVDVERTRWIVAEDDARIEVVIDRGDVRGSGGRAAICELELELEQGEPACLFALARRIAAVVPLRISVLSKAGRGYRIGSESEAVKAEAPAIDPDMAAGEALPAIVQACLRQYRLNEAILLDARCGEAVHQARVALRRLRSGLSLFRPMLRGDPKLRRLSDGLRDLARILGKARDIDVLVGQLEPGRARDVLAAASEQAYADVANAIEAANTRALMVDLVEWVGFGAWRSDKDAQLRDCAVADFAADVLDDALRKVRRRGRDLADIDEEALHQLRKDAKKLRYGAEFFAPAFPGRKATHQRKRFLHSLEALSDALGVLTDAAMASELVSALGLADEPDAVALGAHEKRGRLLRRAQRHHDKLVERKPFWR